MTILKVGGTFVLPPPTKPLIFIAGGIGITPFMSMLFWIQAQSLDYHVTLFYSNRSQEASAYLTELQILAKQLPSFKLIASMTDDPSWDDEKRRIDGKLIQDYVLNFSHCLFMMVGPPVMVQGIQEILQNLGIPSDQLLFEKLIGY